MIDTFRNILKCTIFCKTPVGNTFIINNADKKAVGDLIKELSEVSGFNIENNDTECIIKIYGETVVFRY